MTSRSKLPRKPRNFGAVVREAMQREGAFMLRHQRWADAVKKLEAVIERLRDAPAPMGNKWRDSQVAYFEAQLRDLKATEPQRK